MSDFSMFLAPNVETVENVKLAVSKRFKDKDGKPALWEFRPFTAEEDDTLRKKFTVRVQVPGKKNQYTSDFDANGYVMAKVAAQCVFPDLKNAELQDSWAKNVGRPIMGEVALLKVMLTDNEFQELAGNLAEAFQQETLSDMRDEAKN